MTQIWSSEKDKLIEQLRDQYRGRQWAKSEKDSPFHGDSFYKLFDPNGVAIGEIPLTGRLFKRLGIAFGFVLAVSMGWLMAGGVVWTGYQESEVMRGGSVLEPSTWGEGMNSNFRTSMPTIAFSGQEIVLHYQMEIDKIAAPTTTFADIIISCFCPSSNWRQFRIVSSGEDTFVLPIKNSGIYRVRITQYPRNTGEKSRGFYWWGVRNGK